MSQKRAGFCVCEELTMSVGYIYILTNPSMTRLLKIGFTNGDVNERVRQLSAATGVPKPFDVLYYCLTRDVEEIERKVHEHFSSHRVEGKEFFSAPAIDVVMVIDSLVKKVEPDRFCAITEESLSAGPPYYCPSCRRTNAYRNHLLRVYCPNCKDYVQHYCPSCRRTNAYLNSLLKLYCPNCRDYVQR